MGRVVSGCLVACWNGAETRGTEPDTRLDPLRSRSNTDRVRCDRVWRGESNPNSIRWPRRGFPMPGHQGGLRDLPLHLLGYKFRLKHVNARRLATAVSNRIRGTPFGPCLTNHSPQAPHEQRSRKRAILLQIPLHTAVRSTKNRRNLLALRAVELASVWDLHFLRHFSKSDSF